MTDYRRPLPLAVLLGFAAGLSGAPAAAVPPEPRPALAWPTGPLEVRVALDAPVEAGDVARLVGEVIRFPGNDPYLDAPEAAAYGLRIAGVRAVEGGRTLVLATDPHPTATTYHLPDTLAPAAEPLTYDLNGVEVGWFEGDAPDLGAEPSWSAWWPGLNPHDAREATARSVEHERGFGRIAAGPGTLALRTLVALPAEATVAAVRLESDRPFEATLGFEVAASADTPEGSHRIEITAEVFPGQPAELNVTLPTGPGDGRGGLPTLRAWRIDGEEAVALDHSQVQLPWAPMAPPHAAEVPPPPYDLAGGDPVRGREVFRSEVAKCASCHQIGGEGGEVGPALDKLAGADPARIYRDLADPSASITPDYVTYTVALRDGRVAVGVVRAEGADRLKVLDTDARETVVDRDQVEDLLPSGTSVMPVGLAGALGEERVRDLIAYLRSENR